MMLSSTLSQRCIRPWSLADWLVEPFLMVSIEESKRTMELDQKAIEAINNGEIHRFEELVERYQHRIVGLIGRQVGDQATAEDLAQDVFIRAFKGLKSFKGDSQFSTWLYTISHNVVSSYFSSRKHKEKKKSEQFEPSKHEVPNPSNIEEEIAEEMKNALRSALQELKPHFRDVVILCSLEGKQYEETAQILSIPVGTVRSRLNKARLLLRASLGGVVHKGAKNA